MKEICAGTKHRSDVVHECLEQYREVFILTSQRIDVLKAVRSIVFPCQLRLGIFS